MNLHLNWLEEAVLRSAALLLVVMVLRVYQP